MPFWTEQETELLIAISESSPNMATIATNWGLYKSDLERCPAFALNETKTNGEVIGDLDLSTDPLMFFDSFPSAKDREIFNERASEIAEPRFETSAFRPAPGERETLISACADNPYWLRIDTDMPVWMERLDQHPFALLLRASEYTSGNEPPVLGGRAYLMPRSLLAFKRVVRTV